MQTDLVKHELTQDLVPDDDNKQLTKAEACELTCAISQGLLNTWDLVKRAYSGRVWIGMGYTSWQDWCDKEFNEHGQYHLRIPHEDRKQTVASLKDAGLSIRAISSVTHLCKDTISKDIRDAKTEGVLKQDTLTIGQDGKTYQSKPVIEKPAPKEATVRPITVDATKEATVKPAKPSKHFDYSAPGKIPKGGSGARMGRVRMTLTVTHDFDIDLDSIAYAGIKSLEAAAKVEIENANDSPEEYMAGAIEDGADLEIDYKWI